MQYKWQIKSEYCQNIMEGEKEAVRYFRWKRKKENIYKDCPVRKKLVNKI